MDTRPNSVRETMTAALSRSLPLSSSTIRLVDPMVLPVSRIERSLGANVSGHGRIADGHRADRTIEPQ
jgi:hypothetical protein